MTNKNKFKYFLDYKISAINYYKKVKNYSLIFQIYNCNRFFFNTLSN